MSRLQAGGLAKAVDLIYEAALRPELWRYALNTVAEVLGSDNIGIFAYPNTSAHWAVWSEGNDELVDWFFREGWHLKNPRPERALKRFGMMRVVTEADMFTPWELDNLPFNQAMIHQMGYRWDAGAMLGEIDGDAIAFTTQRLGKRERFDRQDTDAIGALAPHLARAIQITARLGLNRAEGMLDALESLGCAGALIDRAGRLRRLNAKAEQLLGHGIALRHGKLCAMEKSAEPAFQRLIAEGLSPPSLERGPRLPAAVLPRRQGRPLVAYAIPVVRSAQDLVQAAVILILVDPDEHRDPVDIVLQQAFGLTAAEIRIAKGIARGEDLKDIAEKHGISIGTARAQLKSVMAKSETHRQSELVSLMMRLSGPMNFVENGIGRLQRTNSSLR
jgi:DNA-binding CsgD family transcriptional regulator